MAANPAQSRYLADSVSTATPVQLVVMLYDRLRLDLHRADQALEGSNLADASQHLLHAQQIIAELMASLTSGIWDGADNLLGLYGFLIRELVQVNLYRDTQRLAKCAEVVGVLRSAWREAAVQLSAGLAVTAGGSAAGAWVA